MNVLFINEYIYPNVVSGAEFSMQALAEALKKKGENVIFFGPNLSKKKINSFQELKIIRFPFIKKLKPYQTLTPFWFNNPIFWLYSVIFIILACKKEKIDIIHVHGKYLLPGAIISRLFTKTPVIITVRDYKFLCPLALCLIKQNKICNWNYFIKKEIKFYLDKYESKSSFIKRFFLIPRIILARLWQKALFLFLKSADKIICVSNAVKDIYKGSGLSEKKLTAIYNLPPKAEKTASPQNSKTILYVGKLSYGKGTDLLIEAYKTVKKKIPDANLILAGSLSNSIDIIPKEVTYLGKLKHNEVLDLYKKTSVYVSPSRWPEPLSRSTLEALSFGLPLIVSNKGGNKEVVINGKNGYLVDLNAQKITEKILLLLRNEIKRTTFSKKSINLLQTRFNRSKTINQHLNIYNNLVKQKKGKIYEDK